jgi:hypothetical protein
MAVTVDFLVLADMATVADGKLYIHGAAWDRIFGPSFPLKHSFSVALRLNVPWNDTNHRFHFEFDIVDEDGASVYPEGSAKTRGELVAGRPPDLRQGDAQVVPIAIRLNVTFPKEGTYRAILRVDDEEAAGSLFHLVRRPASA